MCWNKNQRKVNCSDCLERKRKYESFLFEDAKRWREEVTRLGVTIDELRSAKFDLVDEIVKLRKELEEARLIHKVQIVTEDN